MLKRCKLNLFYRGLQVFILLSHSLYTGLIPQTAPTYDNLKSDPHFADEVDSLNEAQKQRLRDNTISTTDLFGYFIEQSTRVCVK